MAVGPQMEPNIEQKISILLGENPAILLNGCLNQEGLGILNMTLEKPNPLEDVSPILKKIGDFPAKNAMFQELHVV